MATISEDYLNSLPSDERAEFVQNALDFLSMNPSEQDEMMAQNIRGWYEDHKGRVIKCTFCRKEEGCEEEFGQCARCGIVQYCNRDCQKRDWKQHKIQCRKSEDDQDAAFYKKIQLRISQFDNFYTPIIHRLVLDWYRLLNKEMNTSDISFPENAVVEIQLADLPQSAKRPRLYIKQVLVAKLSNYEMNAAYSSNTRRPEPGYKNVQYCLSYSYGPGEDEIFTTYYRFQYRLDTAERSEFKRASKKMYSENVDEHEAYINSVARGEKPKVYKVIKQVLKEKHG